MKADLGALRTLLVSLSLLAAVGAAGGDDPRSFRAVRASAAPEIDGTPDEPVWQTAEPITGFVQQQPDTGKPAIEQTVVRIVYDDDAIYVAAWLRDPEPVTARLARRDAFLPADWFAVYLDTHHDHRTARMFRVNPLGVQRDSLLEESDQEDRSWDAVWDSAARITADGWTAELRIPYSQLRFPNLPVHVWGVNFHREVARTNEYSRLAHVPRNESGFVPRFAHLTGIEGITPPRRLELLPYVAGRMHFDGTVDEADPFLSGRDRDEDGGIDLKYGLSSNLTLSATLNPDFGQVEVDPAEVNLSQFELFFEERRPFFLEGADLFTFTGTDLFYSRRIGRRPQGSPVGDYDFAHAPDQTAILGAAKLSGRTAGGWSIGILDALTREESATLALGTARSESVVEPQTNYFAARVNRDIGANTRMGAMLTNVLRDNPPHLESLHGQAWTGGVDGYHYFGRREYVARWAFIGSRVSGEPAAITRTQRAPARYFQRPDADHLQLDETRTSLTGWSADTSFDRISGKWRFGFRGNAASPGLEINDIGFKTRVDTINTAFSGLWVDPEPRGVLRDRDLAIAKADRYNFDGDHTLDRIFGDGGVTFSNYWRAGFSWRHDRRVVDDRLTRGGPLAMMPGWSRARIDFSTDRRKAWVLELDVAAEEGELQGYGREVELGLTWQPRSNLSLEIEPSWSRWRDPVQYVTSVGDPSATATYGRRYVFAPVERREIEVATRLDWAITRTLTVQLYLQPFIASGDYVRFHELARPASLDYAAYDDVTFDPSSNRYTVDPDGAGPSQAFTIANPDFNLRSLRGNLVTRWEFRPGSALYVVWAQDRSETADVGSLEPSRDFRAVAGLPADDVVMIKVSYWFGL